MIYSGDPSVMLLELTLPQETVYLSEVAFDRYEPRITKGGIGELSGFVSLDTTSVPSSELAITVSEKDDARMQKLLEGAYDCRRSPAILNRWTPGGTYREFTGILRSWDFSTEIPGTVTLRLQVDDSVLQNSWVPHLTVLKGEWGEGSFAMPDGVAGICVPYVYGAHKSAGVTAKGFVPLPCVGQSGSSGRYLVSWGRVLSMVGTWRADGSAIAGTLEILQRGGKTFSTVKFTSGITAGLVINGDFEGYEAVGDGTGALISNPVQQLRHLLNVIYGDHRTGNWATSDVAPIHAVSWAAAAEWCDRMKLEGSAYIGGTADKVSLRQVIERWLQSFAPLKLVWNQYGQLAIVNLAAAIEASGYPTATSRRISADSQTTGIRTKVAMDVSAIARQVTASYLFAATEGKSYATIDVQDPSIVDKVTTSLQMDWSLARAA